MTNKTRVLASIAVLVLVCLLLHREFARGTFNRIESAFVGWLAANVNTASALPPLAVVLYDEEASAVAGAERMGALDVALFARAAARVGALAAGVDNLPGDPLRMLEAAEGMPMFGGYALENAPAMGWTPWAGEPGAHWQELPGLVGPASTRFPRGFFAAPEGAPGVFSRRRRGRADRVWLCLPRATRSGLSLRFSLSRGRRRNAADPSFPRPGPVGSSAESENFPWTRADERFFSRRLLPSSWV